MDQFQKIKSLFLLELKKANNNIELNNLQSKYLGKNSELDKLIKKIKSISPDEKKELGKKIHFTKTFILDTVKEKRITLNEILLQESLANNKIDVTLPGLNLNYANNHPITIIKNEIKKIFSNLGYRVVSGTEVDSVKYNFELLDIPNLHPARNENDCFYITKTQMLRTHSTNVTAKMLSTLTQEDYKNTIGILSMGNVYRRDTDDATHTHQFSQIDGVLLGENISFANLKWTLEYMCKHLFGKETKLRMRASYFPFTRLSAEVDINCFYCKSNGCQICKQTGWIEILGSGMLSRKVLDLCKIPKGLSALAFGIGVERIAMLKYSIDDIRKLYSNDLNFLKQFKHF